MASSSTTGAPITHRIASIAAAAVLAGSMLVPATAFAAESITVGEDYYEAGEARSGEGSEGGSWSWDGANDMQLNNYVGHAISAEGTLNVDLTGTNVIKMEDATPDNSYNLIEGVSVSDAYDVDGNLTQKGDLLISGTGSLTVTNGSTTGADEAVGISSTSLSIDCASVTVDIENAVKADNSSDQYGVITGSLAMRNGATLDVTSTNNSYETSFVDYDDEGNPYTVTKATSNGYGVVLYTDADGITSTIDDSVIKVKANFAPLEVWHNLTIKDSEATLSSSYDTALYVSGTLKLANSDLDAASPEGEYAVLARNIELSEESGTTTINLVRSYTAYDGTVYTWYTLGTLDPVQNVVKLRRTGETPKHLRSTVAATAKAGLAQTGDPFNAVIPAALAAGAVALLIAGRKLGLRNDEE